jgi:RNA-directed DNA polymerase
VAPPNKQMKRRNNLLVKVAEIDNLRLAFWKAGKGKRYSQEVLAYAEGLDESLLLLQSEIVSGAISVGSYNYLKFMNPKKEKFAPVHLGNKYCIMP